MSEFKQCNDARTFSNGSTTIVDTIIVSKKPIDGTSFIKGMEMKFAALNKKKRNTQ